MRPTCLMLASLLAIIGCSEHRRSPWHHQSVNLTDVEALTLVTSAYYLDGGTTEIYAITESGKRCFIRLNQHSLLGDYELDNPDSPGRLCFNERLITVRSSGERPLLELLQSARLMPITIDDLQMIHGLDSVSASDLDKLSVLNDKGELKRYRDAIVNYVKTDQYVEVAQLGIPYVPATDG